MLRRCARCPVDPLLVAHLRPSSPPPMLRPSYALKTQENYNQRRTSHPFEPVVIYKHPSTSEQSKPAVSSSQPFSNSADPVNVSKP